MGTREEVTRLLWEAQRSGADLALSSPRVLPDGRWSVVVERAPTPPRHHPDKPRRAPTAPRQGLATRWWMAGCGVLLAAVGALAWAIWWVATWLVAHVAQILGALAVVLLLAVVLGGVVGGRSGRHCPGPWHR